MWFVGYKVFRNLHLMDSAAVSYLADLASTEH